MINKLFLLILLLMASLRFTQAQEYYITLKNDTIRGEIKSFDSKGIKFRPEGESSNQKVNIAEVKAFYNKKDKIVYFRQYLPDKKGEAFVKLLENGRIKLFELLDIHIMYAPAMGFGGVGIGGVGGIRRTSKQKNWYASKDGSALEEIKTTVLIKSKSRNERKDSFYNLFTDDTEIMASIKDSNQFNFDAIRLFIRKYNDRNPAKK